MNNLNILLKNSWNMLVGRLQGKKQRKSILAASLTIVVVGLALAGLYSWQAWAMFDGLGQWGLGKLCMFHACITSVAVLIMIGTLRFSAPQKDTDLLLSLPIKKRDIVISKAISLYLFDLAFVVILFLPYIIIYQIKCAFDLQALLLGLLLVLLMPLFSVGLSYIFDFIVSHFFNKFKIGNMLKSIFMVLIFVVVLGFLLIKTSTYGLITSLDGYFEERPISNLLLNFMFNTNFLNVLLVLLMTVGVFAVGLVLYAKNFGKSTVGYHSKSTELKFKESKSSFGLMFKKELYNYANTTAFIVNTIIGAVLILALGIFLATSGIEGLNNLLGIPVPKDLLIGILVLAFCGISSTGFISACTVSLEGNNWWIIKSSPISLKDLFLSKACLQIAVMEPPILLSSIILALSLPLTFVEFLTLLVLPTLHVLIMSFAGVLINLWLPNFDWDDPTKVVKQSMSSLFSMLFGVVLTVILFGVYKLFVDLPLAIIALICSGVYVLLLVLSIVLLFTIGKKLYEKT